MNYQGLLDMIDGGGAGASGSRFKGGGLLSDIANAVARPAGQMSQQQMAQARPQARPAMPQMQAPPPVQAQPLQPMQQQPVRPPQMPQGMPQPMQYGPQNGRPSLGPQPQAQPQQAMPYPEWAGDNERQVIDYLRSLGDTTF